MRPLDKMTHTEREALQQAAEQGHLDPARIKAEAELKAIRQEAEDIRGRHNIIAGVIQIAAAIENCRPEDIERLTKFFYAFVNGRESDHGSS